MFKIVVPLVFLAASCNAHTPPAERAEAQRVADSLMASKGLLSPRLRVTVDDAGQEWLVTYQIPEGSAGGDHRIWVNKRTMKVVASVGSQ
jgi:hypothetical protein